MQRCHSVAFPPSGHTECLDLLLSRGAHVDVELPAVGTPLYSACAAQTADCVTSLLHSGRLADNSDPCLGQCCLRSDHTNGQSPLSHYCSCYSEDPHLEG